MGTLNTYTAQTTVSPNSTETARMEFSREATVTSATIRTYLGQEFSLLTECYIHTSDDADIHLLDPGAVVDTSYPHALGGDDTVYNPHFREEVERGDELVIKFHNTDSDNTYHGDATVTYDEEFSALSRVASLFEQVI